MLLRLLTRYIRPYWPYFAGVLVFQLCQTFAQLYLPSLNAAIIDNGVATGDTGYIWGTGVRMLLVALLQVVLAIAGLYCGARMAMSVGRDLRRDIYGHVSEFSEQELSQFGTGSLITRSTNDVQQVQIMTHFGSVILVSAPCLAIGGVIMALRQDVGLSWLMAVAIVALLAVAGYVTMAMLPAFRTYQSRLDNLNRILREQLTGIRVLRAFVREDTERARFSTANRDMTRVATRIGTLFVIVFPMAMVIMNVALVGVYWFGGHQVDEGTTQVGTLVAYMTYLMQILSGILMAAFMSMMIPRASVSAERINEVLRSETSVTFRDDVVTSLPAPGRVEFRHVEFSYPGAEEAVVSDVSFVAEPGSTVAFIGSTGSGKTTVANLIPRLYDATAGQVLVGGVNVRDLSSAALASAIGYVPQKPYLFSGTVASNLRFGREDATEADMWEALEIAQAKDFVEEMPGGLDAPISQGGTNVSGGQRQRLAIARAIIHRPHIYLFDDAFSALDLATDARLRAQLWERQPDVTKIVVAQRVSTITDADLIVVLDAGRVVGMGTHAQLLESTPEYREIVESQLGAEAK